MSKAIFVGKEFKSLISAVTRYPSIGSFAGAELINLRVGKNIAIATTSGVALSKAKIHAEGELPLIGIGIRELSAFAGICHDTAKVYIEIKEKQLSIKSKGREIVLPLADGHINKLPEIAGDGIVITKEIADRISYLAQIAYNDTAKAELNCVMLTAAGQAIAVNQKAIASLKCGAINEGKVALPILLAKGLSKGDTVYPGVKETVVKSGIGVYCAPSPVQAQKSFPVEAVQRYGETKRDILATLEGAKLAAAVVECNAILGQITRTEVVVTLLIGTDKLEVLAENGSVKFRAVVPLLSGKQETELKVPIEEMLHASVFLGKQTTIAKGKNEEVFMSFAAGWTMFPRWRQGKK